MKRNREVIGSNDWGEWSSDGDSGKSRGMGCLMFGKMMKLMLVQ